MSLLLVSDAARRRMAALDWVDKEIAALSVSAARGAALLVERAAACDTTRQMLAALSQSGKKPPSAERIRHLLGRRRAGGPEPLPRASGLPSPVPRPCAPEGSDPDWFAAFLPFYWRPQKPPLAEAYRAFVAAVRAGETGLPERSTPSFWQVRYALKKLTTVDKHRDRRTGSAARALLPYVKRDWASLNSNDVWIGDGHGFKARVGHPVHGQPFVPEFTGIMVAGTGFLAGWSVSLAESTLAVADAFRHAQQTTGAVPLVYYSDNGAGQTANLLDAALTGFFARQGIEHRTGLPGNPQARGLIERFWREALIPLARTYPTCVWRGADENYVTRIGKALARKDRGGVQVPTWSQFLDDVTETVRVWNYERRFPATAYWRAAGMAGKTPWEIYQARLDPDSVFYAPDDPALVSLWMPEETRLPRRGLIELHGKTYFRRDLVHRLPDGEPVRVRFDIHDAATVWLYRMDGVFLGEAELDGHKKSPFPLAYLEQKRAERRDRRIKKLEKEIALAKDEAGQLLEHSPAMTPPTLVVGGRVTSLPAEAEPAPLGRRLQDRPGGHEERPPNPPAPAADSGFSAQPKTYALWLAIDAAIKGGQPVGEDEAYWHQSFQRSVKFAVERERHRSITTTERECHVL